MGFGSVIEAAVTDGLAMAVATMGDMTALFAVLVGIGIVAATFAIVAAFVKR